MEMSAHHPILKRTGMVVLVVGLLDMAWMVYSFLNGLTSTLKFNVFAIVAGIFLLRGSLRAASAVRWLSTLGIAAIFVMILVTPFVQPWGLTLTQLRLHPVATVASNALALTYLGLLAWLCVQLGSAPVLNARAAAGRPLRNMRIPALVGVALSLTIAVSLFLFIGGETAKKAESLAAQKLGNSYRYHLNSLNIQTGNQGTSVSGVVTAWNESEIRQVPVRWTE